MDTLDLLQQSEITITIVQEERENFTISYLDPQSATEGKTFLKSEPTQLKAESVDRKLGTRRHC